MLPYRRFVIALLSVLAAGTLPATAGAAPGDFDTSFGTSGKTDISSNFGPTAAEDVAVAPDGKLVAVGEVVHNQTIGDTSTPLVHDWVAARLTADGQPDTTFHGNGISQPLLAQTNVAPPPDTGPAYDLETGSRGAAALAVLGNGDIVMTGQDAGNNAPITVLKVQGSGAPGDGSLITSFGNASPSTDGSATIPLVGSTLTTAEAIAVAPDGTIVVAGHAFISGIEKSFVARFNSNGTSDTTFNGGNAVMVLPDSSCDDVGSASSCDANALALKTSGADVTAIFVGGWNGGDQVGGRVWKLIPGSGQANFGLDTSFWDPKGAVWLPRHTLSNIQTLVVQSDGQIAAAGYRETNDGSEQCGFARLSSTGALGTSGQVTLGGSCVVRGMARATDGTYPFAGEVWSGTQRSGNEQILVGRFDSSGQADSTFAPDGAVAMGTAPAYAAGMTLSAGKVVTAGAEASPSKLMLARFLGGAGAKDLTPPAVTLTRPADQSISQNFHPVLAGAAGTAPGDQAKVTILWKNVTSGARLGKYQATVSGGRWTYAPTSVGPGQYRVQAIQGDAAGNVGQSAVHTFFIEPLPVRNAVDTSKQRNMPNVVGKGVAAAVTLISNDLVYANVNYIFKHDVTGCTGASDVGRVLGQSPKPGEIADGANKPVEATLEVCFGGEKAIATCNTTALKTGLEKLGLKATDTEVLQDFILAYDRCVDEYQVQLTQSKSPQAQPDFTKVTVTNPKHGANEIRSVINCPEDPQAEDLHIGLSEGAAEQAITPGDQTVNSWGFRASGPEGWTLPAGYPSYFKLEVLDRAWRPVQARIFVDPSDVAPGEFTKGFEFADNNGEQIYHLTPGRTGTIRICAAVAVGKFDLYGTTEIRVVSPPDPGVVWETTTGRRIMIPSCQGKPRPCSDHPIEAAPARDAGTARASDDPLTGLINFLKWVFGGKSKSVNQAVASSQPAPLKLQRVYAAHLVSPMEINTCGGGLKPDPARPVVIDEGQMIGKVGDNVGTIKGPVVAVPGGKCGAVVVGTEEVTASEAQKAGVKPGIVSDTGAGIVSTGGSNIVAQGGGNLISQDGGGLISQDGSSIVSTGGSNARTDNLLAATGPAGLGPDVSSIVAQGGGNIVAQGGGNLATKELP